MRKEKRGRPTKATHGEKFWTKPPKTAVDKNAVLAGL
jgi:hypothetical protein